MYGCAGGKRRAPESGTSVRGQSETTVFKIDPNNKYGTDTAVAKARDTAKGIGICFEAALRPLQNPILQQLTEVWNLNDADVTNQQRKNRFDITTFPFKYESTKEKQHRKDGHV